MAPMPTSPPVVEEPPPELTDVQKAELEVARAEEELQRCKDAASKVKARVDERKATVQQLADVEAKANEALVKAEAVTLASRSAIVRKRLTKMEQQQRTETCLLYTSPSPRDS